MSSVHGEVHSKWSRFDTMLLLLFLLLVSAVFMACVHGDPAAPSEPPCFKIFTHWNYIGNPPTAMRLVQDSIVRCK